MSTYWLEFRTIPRSRFFTIKSSCFRESRTLNTPGVAVVYSIASPSSTCLALYLRGAFRELFHTMVTRLCDNDPLAFPGISPRGELMTQSAHSVSRTTSSNRQFIIESVLVLNQDPCTWGDFSKDHLFDPRISMGAPSHKRESRILRHLSLETSNGIRFSVTESHYKKSRYTDFDIFHMLQVCPMNLCTTGNVESTV
jgi:hypothetical protein